MSKTYLYREETGHEESLAATSMADAVEEARDLLHDGDWPTDQGTVWPCAWVVELDEDGEETGECEHVRVAIEPDEPECIEPEHAWQSPYEILGGLRENPGVRGKGGGVVTTEVCAHCGVYRITDTWAQDRSTGEQGLRSVRYDDADETSASWARSDSAE